MQIRTRGQTRRVPAPLLPIFMGGTLPQPHKAVVAEAVRELGAMWAADPEACIPPPMLLRLNGSLGCPTLQTIDLLRILLGRPPHDPAHSRRNLSALLRGKAAQQRRAPRPGDFPADHPLQVLAHAYWGGIDAWGRGQAARIQQPKNHWLLQANQVAALHDAASRFPRESLTHELLRRAGYHALARRLDAAALAELAAGCGLTRQLQTGSAADWTADRVVADYVALCHHHGVTLSSDALRTLGGAASSLRSRGVHFFGSHAGLVLAAVAADPGIRPLERPTTPDGIVLGSWAEVTVYAALRSGLPADAVIRPQVPLTPELPRHSCDFVVGRGGRHVWVEVLMVSPAEMRDPDANAVVRRYAQRWQVKGDWYQAKGVELVTVEPTDVFAPTRLEAAVAEICRHLVSPAEGCALGPVPAAPALPESTTRPRRFWTKRALCEAVRGVAGASLDWPTNSAMIAAGYGGAMLAIRRRRLRAKVAATCGLRLVNQRGAWTEARIVDELVARVQSYGTYPTRAAVRQTGLGRLENARQRLFVGRTAALRAMVEARCQLAPGGSAAPGSYDTPEALAALLRPLCDQFGRFPTRREMAASGLPTTVYDRVSRGGGVAAMAAWMGVRYAGPARLTRQEALRLLLTAAEPPLLPGEPPRITTTMLRTKLGSRGLALLRRQFGSIAGLRQAPAEQARAADGG